MKNMLLLLLSLTVLSAWAGDVPVTSSSSEASAQASQVTPKQKTKHVKKHKAKKTAPVAADQSAVPLACPVGCVQMNCPPPTGPAECCNTTTHHPC